MQVSGSTRQNSLPPIRQQIQLFFAGSQSLKMSSAAQGPRKGPAGQQRPKVHTTGELLFLSHKGEADKNKDSVTTKNRSVSDPLTSWG